MAFIDRIGKTQGIRFKIKPPMKADPMAIRIAVTSAGALAAEDAPRPEAPGSGGPGVAATS